ncbi:MAG: hypothetical protein K2X57_28835 [Xanthobacteraceae bacterium]|nr:hypothetical protein [Xanthobacteraceae bacterium]
MASTGIAVIESNWWRGSNVSVRNLYDLIAEISCKNPNSYHYEMANTEAALKEAIERISSYRDCRYLSLAMHGDGNGLRPGNENLSRTELRNVLKRIRKKRGAKWNGIYMGTCLFGTHELAEFIFQAEVGIRWIAGYTEAIGWIESSAMDLLFFNELLNTEGTETQRIGSVANKLLTLAPGLVQNLGFGIYVRKQRTGGAKNLLVPMTEE